MNTNRRGLFGMLAGLVGGVFAAFQPKKKGIRPIDVETTIRPEKFVVDGIRSMQPREYDGVFCVSIFGNDERGHSCYSLHFDTGKVKVFYNGTECTGG